MYKEELELVLDAILPEVLFLVEWAPMRRNSNLALFYDPSNITLSKVSKSQTMVLIN